FLNAAFGAPDWEAAAASLEVLVEKSVEKEETRKAIKKDLRGLASELKKRSPGFGARSAYVVRTADGYDGFYHAYGDHSRYEGVKTPLFDYVGDDAILAAALGFPDPGPSYAVLSKYTRTFYDYLETAFLGADVDDEYKQAYKKHAPGMLEALKKLD